MQRWVVAGNGAWAGVLPYGGMASALAAGYATAGTDTGHVGNNADFVPGHPEKLVDFAYRAIHETTVAAKALLNAYYGRAPAFSYFRGCSTGGRQALTSAQRYPQDFDRTRPLCPFGQVARWNGSGSTDDEKNFTCVGETADTTVRPVGPAPRR